MAATTSPLVWDFYREVEGAEGLGSCLEFFTTDSQSLYLADGLKTRLAMVEDGHWSDAEPGAELTILEDAPALSAWDHALTGQLYGVGVSGSELIAYRYLYARELTQLLRDGSWRAKNDSQITQLSLTLLNPGADIVVGYGTMFEPGARVSVGFCMGASRAYPMGVAFLDEIDFDAQSPTFSISGRNNIGYRLQQQTFDDETAVTGGGHDVAEWILTRAGITDFVVAPSEGSWDWTFEPSDTFYSGMQKIFEAYPGWGVIETPAGKIVVGYAYFRSQFLGNGVYQFREGTDVIKRRTRKNADAAYTNVRVTGKAADGTELEPVYLAVENFAHWALGATKTKHVKADDGLTQEQLQAFAEQTAAELAHIGVGETFNSPPRPWLLVGDVASIITGDAAESEDLGLITSITHRFGNSGYFTEFAVDSGGSVQLTRAADAVTRTASVRGYNRRQDLADLIGVIAKERS